MTTKGKTELYYSVTEPDYDVWDNGKYQHATVRIFVVTPELREDINRIYTDKAEYGDKYVSDSAEIVVLTYQRDRARDKDLNETNDPDKRVISEWYAEEIQYIPRCYSGLDVDKIDTFAKLLRKMEKKSDEIYKNGLDIRNSNDQYKTRVFLLKAIGAKELYYSTSSHRYYHSVGVKA